MHTIQKFAILHWQIHARTKVASQYEAATLREMSRGYLLANRLITNCYTYSVHQFYLSLTNQHEKSCVCRLL
jgi:hypothetical protein